MFMGNITLRVIIFCIVSLFIGLPLAEAYPGTAEYETAGINRDNAFGQEEKWETLHAKAKPIVDLLLEEWVDNETAIKDGTWEVIDTVAATLIAEMVRTINQDSDDSNVVKTINALPTLFGLYQSWKSTAETKKHIAKRDKYLLALNTAIETLNMIREENLKAFNTYEDEYDAYLELVAEDSHSGGLVRVPNYNLQGDYSSVTASSLEHIKTAVKAKTAFENNVLKNWYHPDELRSGSQPTNHSIHLFYNFVENWSLPELPKNKACGGDCGQQFQTPVEHLVICPYSLTDSSLQAGDRELTDLPIDALLNGAVSPAGCNIAYYLCSSSDREKHKIRKCGKGTKEKDGSKCHILFRKCTNPSIDHGGLGNTGHKEIIGTFFVNPWDFYFMALPGDSHTAELTASEPYSSVKWFVASPSETGRGTLIETDTGDGTLTTASMDYTFPSGVTGDYVITGVFLDSNAEEIEASYTVSVGSGSTSTATLSPSNGSYTASAGDSHNAVLSILSKGASIGFYVITPNDAINVVSTFLETWAGDGTASAASIDYTFPSNVSGDYTFYATISYNDGTSHSPHPSYTVAVSTPPPAPTTTLLPANGLYTATDANSHTANFSISEAYSSVKWHVKSPSETGLGTRIETDYGDGSTTTADFTYTFPLNVSGDYVITANGLTSSGLSFEDSYTVSVTIFIPSFSLSASTYSPGSGLSVSVSANDPIFGCHLFVRSPGDTSTYGTKIGWFGNSRSTSQSISYTLPTTAASGRYKITVRVYPWYGNTWGAPKYLQKYVNVSSD